MKFPILLGQFINNPFRRTLFTSSLLTLFFIGASFGEFSISPISYFMFRNSHSITVRKHNLRFHANRIVCLLHEVVRGKQVFDFIRRLCALELMQCGLASNPSHSSVPRPGIQTVMDERSRHDPFSGSESASLRMKQLF